ncbi:MAG: hypothetical protein MJK08_13840 [Campylobacterales bacterium]|nr:hypothetical protein [Campylobacterales bacterium]
MNIFVSILYAPIVFYSINNFEIKKISIIIFLTSLLWLIFSIKKGFKEFIFPIFYIVFSILAFILDDFIFLKIIPLLLSILISAYIYYTYKIKNSFIFIFLERMKINVEEKEKIYIQKSTFFWFITSVINIIIHLIVLVIDNIYWLYYTTFLWYFVFIIAGILQFIHKRIYFSKEKNV